MKKKYRVLLLADHKWRDLPGLAYLKVCLEDQCNIEVFSAPVPCFDIAMFKVKPHLVLFNHMNGAANHYMARFAKAAGSLVGVLPNEGKPTDGNMVRYIGGEQSDLSLVDLWMNWGEGMNSAMKHMGRIAPDRLRITGGPRFDFYVPPLQTLLISKEDFEKKHGITPGRPIVSWATNFTLAHHVSRNTLEFLQKDHKDLGMAKYLPNIVESAKKEYEVREKTLHILKDTAKTFPHVNFLLKPHPNEETNTYEEFVQNCKQHNILNIYLITEEFIWNLLKNASVHIHRLCTTGIESWLMGVPSINFHLEDYAAWDTKKGGPSQESLTGDDHVTDFNSLVERIRFYLNKGEMAQDKLAAQQAFIQKWFFRVDGNSASRCAQEITDCLERNQPKPHPRLRYLSFKGFVKVCLHAVKNRPYDIPLRYKVSKNSIHIDRLGQRDKVILQEDLSSWTQKVREVYGPLKMNSQ